MAQQIPWFFLTISTLVTFALLLVLARWIGSTQLTQLTFFNWVAGASMGNIAANMIDTTSPTNWLINGYTLIIFTACTIIAAFAALKSRSFRRVSNGEPVVLIHEGHMIRENLRKSKVNVDVLLMMLREKGYFSYAEIAYAILEPTGNLSILPIQASQSVSKEDIVKGPDLTEDGQGPYIELIIDGEIDFHNLHKANKDHQWLMDQLHAIQAASEAEVMYMGVNQQGEIIADVRKKWITEERK